MRARAFPIVVCLFSAALSSLFANPNRGADPPGGEKCATCDYLSSQFARMRAGMEPVEDARFVPEGYWDRVRQRRERSPRPSSGMSEFPTTIYLPDTTRTDADGDGLLECRYRIDLSPLVSLGGYSEAEKTAIEGEVRKAFALWNKTMAYVKFEFREVSDGSEHLVVNAIEGSNWTGQTVLYAGVKGNNRALSLNYKYTEYGAYQHLVEPATKNTLIDRPPGNPYGHLVDGNLIRFETRTWPTCTTVLHEIGHLVGLMHPEDAIRNTIAKLGHSENICWLDYPAVGVDPASVQSSTRLGGEDVLAALSSRGLNNSFLAYDRAEYILYPDVTPEMKACMAHYYHTLDPSGAQTLLNLARGEHSLYSPLNGEDVIQETEPNNTPAEAVPIQLGMSVLGAISSWNTAGAQGESYQDPGDYYRFTIGAGDVGFLTIFDVDHGSQFFGKKLEILDTDGSTVLTASEDGSNVPGGYPDPGSAVSGFSFYDDPYLEWRPPRAGTYYVRITRKTEQLWYGDYFLVTKQARAATREWERYR